VMCSSIELGERRSQSFIVLYNIEKL
jgi:hypothetical protein